MTRITHKPWILTFALTLLLVTPFAAVHGQSQDTTQQQNEEQVEPYETRTRATTEGTPQSGKTLRGTVKEVTDENLTIETVTGVEHIQVAEDTELPADLSKGDKVAIDYNRGDQGVIVATEVRLQEADAQQQQAARTDNGSDAMNRQQDEMDRQTDADRTERARLTENRATETERDQLRTDRAESDWNQDRGTQQDATRADQRGDLPQTASGLPLAGLVGLLSLIGALAFRSFRS